jgi:hypothetical protein
VSGDHRSTFLLLRKVFIREGRVLGELAKFAALLLSILSLDAVLHTAFFEPGRNLRQQLLPSLEMLLLAAALSFASGNLFALWEKQVGERSTPVSRTLPMRIFWWGGSLISLLFAAGWYVERFVLHLRV